MKKIFSIADGDAPDGLVFSFDLDDGRGGIIPYQQRQAVFNVSPAKDDDKLYVVLVASAGSDSAGCAEPRLWPIAWAGWRTYAVYRPAIRTQMAATSWICTTSIPRKPSISSFPFPNPGIEYQIIYEYTLRANKLRDPRPIAIFESQGGPLHHGSAMLTLKDGRIMFVTGDAVPFGLSGLAAPQDPVSHLSKLLIVDPETGAWEVAASGLRNVQHMEIVKMKGSDQEYRRLRRHRRLDSRRNQRRFHWPICSTLARLKTSDGG